MISLEDAVPDEKMILGCVLLKPNHWPWLMEQGLTAWHFSRKKHRRIFEAVTAFAEDAEDLAGIDPLTVADQLRQTGDLSTIGYTYLVPVRKRPRWVRRCAGPGPPGPHFLSYVSLCPSGNALNQAQMVPAGIVCPNGAVGAVYPH